MSGKQGKIEKKKKKGRDRYEQQREREIVLQKKETMGEIKNEGNKTSGEVEKKRVEESRGRNETLK